MNKRIFNVKEAAGKEDMILGSIVNDAANDLDEKFLEEGEIMSLYEVTVIVKELK